MKNTKTRIIFFSIALTYNLILGFYLRDFLVLSPTLGRKAESVCQTAHAFYLHCVYLDAVGSFLSFERTFHLSSLSFAFFRLNML